MSTRARCERPLEQCVVVVTPRSFGTDDPGLKKQLESEVGQVVYRPGPLGAVELAEAVSQADGLIAGLDDISAEVFDAAPRLRVVARYGVGTDKVDLSAAADHGVVVTVTPGANANAVAELAVALLFLLARPIFAGRDLVKSGHWPALKGVELAGRCLGLIGLGRVGSLVAAKASALHMSVLAYDPYVEVPRAAPCELPSLLARSDFVSLHVPLTAETKGMLGRRQFEVMKPGAALVNTARGALVDEAALIWALDEGPLRAAALDVLCQEPPGPGPGRLLLERDDVIVTPHMAPHTAEATLAMGRAALEEVLAVLSGRTARFEVGNR